MAVAGKGGDARPLLQHPDLGGAEESEPDPLVAKARCLLPIEQKGKDTEWLLSDPVTGFVEGRRHSQLPGEEQREKQP